MDDDEDVGSTGDTGGDGGFQLEGAYDPSGDFTTGSNFSGQGFTGTTDSPSGPQYMGQDNLGPTTNPYSGSGGGGGMTSGGGASAAASAQYALGMAQLQEQIRQYNTNIAAQQTSAKQAEGGLVNLVNEYNTAYSQAKAGYDQRYNQMLGIAQSTTNQQATDTRSQYAQLNASAQQGLQRQGMGGSTVGNTLAIGNQNNQSQALNRLADQMQQTQLGIIGGYDATGKTWAPSQAGITDLIQATAGSTGNYGGLLGTALGGLTAGSTPAPATA